MIYIHQGQKHIQAIEDPYPKGFPADQAVEHMEAALEYLEQQEDDYGNAHPALEWCGFREVIRARMDAAMLDLHDVSREDLLSVIELAELAEMLGYQASEIGVTKPTVPDRTLARLERAAQAAGLPRESIESMLYALEQ